MLRDENCPFEVEDEDGKTLRVLKVANRQKMQAVSAFRLKPLKHP